MSRIILVVLLLSFSFTVVAQHHYEFHGSALTSQISGDGFNGFKKFGFEAGAGLLFPLKSEGRFLGLSLNYIQKGARDRKNEQRGDFNDYSLKLDYLELPLTYWVPMWGVYFTGGVSAAYRLRFEQLNNDVVAVAPNDLRTIELGLNIGVNFQVNDNVVLTFKGLHSVTPLRKSSAPINYWLSQGGMHSVLAVSLQYFIGTPNFLWVPKSKVKEVEQ